MNKFKYQIFLVISFLLLSFIYFHTFIKADITLLSRVRGMILLQVEKNGEAWFVDNHTDERYFLGRPDDAYAIMRDLSEGIKNSDLKKIPIALENFSGTDTDNDGLSDIFEDAVGTDKSKKDTDNDGFDDFTEIKNQYDPNGNFKLPIDQKFSDTQKGKIFIQVEQNGEAWYVYPKDNKRYFLSRPSDAFSLMRKLGLGIKDADLMLIPQHQEKTELLNDYIVENYTTTSENDNLLIKYSDPKNHFSFEYPNDWKIQKSDDFDNIIFIGDYEKNLFSERKGYISISHISSDKDLILENFEVKEKKGAEKTIDEKSEKNGYQIYTQKFVYPILNSYDVTINIMLDSKNFIQLLLISAGDPKKYDKILEDVLDSFSINK